MNKTKHILFIIFLCFFLSTKISAKQDPPKNKSLIFKVIFHIPSKNTDHIQNRIKTLIDKANEKFGEVNVAFHVEEIKSIPESNAVLDNIRERRSLKKRMVSKVINVFLVDQILDPNPSKATAKAAAWQGFKPSGRLSGAHIKIKNKTPNTYIILSKSSRITSLTHELGHFFGLPHHKDPNNIMSYGSKRELFSERQLKVIRQKAKRHKKKRTVKTYDHK